MHERSLCQGMAAEPRHDGAPPGRNAQVYLNVLHRSK